MWYLVFIIVLAVATTAHVSANNLVEEIGSAQRELYVGHGFFQEQYYRLPSSFGVYVGNFNEEMVTAIGNSVDRFNREVNSIDETLDGLNVADDCLSLWETLQLRYGRSLASCADFVYDEIRMMVSNYDFLIWWSENYITNAVQMHAMNEFVYWNPLMYPDFDVIGGINNELRLTLDDYYKDYVEYIQYIRNYYLANMDSVIQTVQTCSDVYVTSFQRTSSLFLEDARAGRC